MKIIQPITVDDVILTSSNVPENDHSQWNAVTTYNIGDRVISTATHTVYESLADANLNFDPTDAANSDKWAVVSATNRWKLFDAKLADATTNTGSIELEFSPLGPVNSLALFGLDAATVNIVVTDEANAEVYSHTAKLREDYGVGDWWEYFYSLPGQQITETVVFDIPAFEGATIAVDIVAGPGQGTVQAAELVLGNFKSLGDAQYGSSIGITDYSRKDRDDFGNAIIVERDFNQRAEFDIVLETRKARDVQRTLARYRAQPVVWAGRDDGGLGLLVYGYYRDFDIQISAARWSDCTLSVEGLT